MGNLQLNYVAFWAFDGGIPDRIFLAGDFLTIAHFGRLKQKKKNSDF